ncbi:MFS transporter [uncultured Shimia sp.]|uniref:MFS transporter n=1 Tax=uncultured Shimia sp. TaxID=573152 RepID=UPI002618FFD1|nr:MFS transporter [uncultured Shimia sp.]
MRADGFLRANAPFLAAGALMTFMSSYGQTFFISIFAGEIRAEFGLSHGEWGGIYMIGTTASAVVMIWAGVLTDHFRVRVLGPVILFGLACACLAMATNRWAWALPFVIFALRFFGQGMSTHIAVVAMARWFVATRGRALSVASLGYAFGEAILPLLFVALMAVVDWRYLWVAAAGVCLLGIPVLASLLGKERTPGKFAESESSLGMSGKHWTRADALRHPLFWVMVPSILGMSAFGTAFFFHQVHYAALKGMSHVQLVAFFPLFTAMSIGSMVATGWALDKLGTARLIPFYLAPVAMGFLIFAMTGGPVGLFFGLFFFALSAGANATLPNAFWAEFYGTANIGAIKALAAAVMVLGSAIGPGLTGVLIDIGIDLGPQYIGVAIYFVASTLLLRWGVTRAAKTLPQEAM